MITSLVAVQSGALSYLWRAVSDLPGAIFYWWVDGRFFLRTGIGELELPAARDVRVDVFDDAAERPLLGVSYGLEILWEGRETGEGAGPTPQRFRIEHRERALGDGAWSDWESVQEYGAGSSVGVMRHTLRGLTDEVFHGVRVVGVDEVGEEVVLAEKEGRLVRRPDVPVQVFGVAGGVISSG